MNLNRWILFAAFISASTPVVASPSAKITDPYENEGLSCKFKPDGRLRYETEADGYAPFRIIGDLNFDGRDDVILTTERGPTCGKGGCSTVIYLKQVDGSYATTELALNPQNLSLELGKNGGGKLMSYWPSSASDGVFLSYSVTANSIIRTSSETVSTDRRDGEPVQSVREGEVKLRAEYARCKAGMLQWSLLEE